jgi:hypothetical protein
MQISQLPTKPEPRWPGWLAMVAVGGMIYALPSELSPGPDWLVLVLMAAFQVAAIVLHFRGRHREAQAVAYTSLGVATLGLVASLTLLVQGIPSHRETPLQLLVSATMLWISNMLVFASWYWRLDAGGPFCRDLRESHTDGAFLFPQMTLDPALREEMGEGEWRPGFVDYLFLAFNTSTAFSPTDVPVLSRWAKVLMMLQAAVSLATLAILAARAVNIL